MWKKLFPVCLWMEFSCQPPVNVELDASYMSSFRGSRLGKFSAPLSQELGTILGGDSPLIAETRLVVTALGIELRIGWKLRMLTQELEERSVTSAKQAKEVFGEFFS